jgi:hypothetical protein
MAIIRSTYQQEEENYVSQSCSSTLLYAKGYSNFIKDLKLLKTFKTFAPSIKILSHPTRFGMYVCHLQGGRC